MEIKRKFWAGSSALAGVGLVACGACCVPLVSVALAALGAGTIASGIDEAVSLGVGTVLLLLAGLLWSGKRKKADSCSASSSSCGCEAPPPIACTLSPSEFKDRSAWLKQLSAKALMSHLVFKDHALLRYRLDAQADVERMVEQERSCCAFLEFELERMADHLLVTIRARNQDIDDLAILLSHLIPVSAEELH